MNKILQYILLVDDNSFDNFIHERQIRRVDPAIKVIAKNSGKEAMEYLESNTNGEHPNLIFLDINMPCMNGWEFLQAYTQLEQEMQDKSLIIMLTTSENLDDIAKAKEWVCVSDYITKPLTKEIMEEVKLKFFN